MEFFSNLVIFFYLLSHWPSLDTAVSQSKDFLPNIMLDTAGLIALAELAPIQYRAAITGSACPADSFILCPGIHRQQDATTPHGGEYTATANIDSGYVFRVEDQATVAYLQSVGKTGQLTRLVMKDAKSPYGERALVDLAGRNVHEIPTCSLSV